MSRSAYRGLFALAAVVVVLHSSRPATAQVVAVSPRQPIRPLRALVYGSWFEMGHQAKAERRVDHLQAKLNRDAERGDGDAVSQDVRRIDDTQHRIAVDEWLIRMNSYQEPVCYPSSYRLDPITYDAIAQYRCPPRPRGHW